jgi:hypothetical protein
VPLPCLPLLVPPQWPAPVVTRPSARHWQSAGRSPSLPLPARRPSQAAARAADRIKIEAVAGFHRRPFALAPRPSQHEVDRAATAPRAHQAPVPVGDRRLWPVPASLLNRIGLALVTAITAPHHDPRAGRRSAAECRWWAGLGLHFYLPSSVLLLRGQNGSRPCDGTATRELCRLMTASKILSNEAIISVRSNCSSRKL